MVRGSRGHIHTGKDYEVKVHKECTIWGHLYRGGQPASFWGKYYTDNMSILYVYWILYVRILSKVYAYWIYCTYNEYMVRILSKSYVYWVSILYVYWIFYVRILSKVYAYWIYCTY